MPERVMNAASEPPLLQPEAPRPPASRALALSSLILGILALLTGVFVVGAFFGLIGLIVGVLHVARRTGRNGTAWAGIVLSVLGILIGVVAFATVVRMLPKIKERFQKFLVSTVAEDTDFERWKGVAAPDFVVRTLDGRTLRLSELRGRRVILDFWATWCPPCVKEIPHFIQLRKDLSESDLVIVGISKEDEPTLREFVKRKGINYPIGSADDLPAPYKDVSAIPTTFFIDRRGVIQEVLVGYHDLETLRKHATATDTTEEPKPAPQDGSSNETAPEPAAVRPERRTE